jgi:DNA gyrase subunit A
MEDLLRFIPGPDFPTGGVVYRYAKGSNGDAGEQEDAIAMAYASGKGSIVLQAKAHIEEMSRSKNRIVVTEIPYQANKANLIERIAELARDGRVEGITDLRDESDRTGMRICVELTRTVDPRDVLATLFKLTPLQQTFSISLLALVADEHGRLEPRLLSLKRLLLHYVEHRQEVILRRSRYELERAKQRAHILEGLLRALDVLDQIIALIRGSRSADDARQGLVKQFQFTELQAQAILDLQLRRLAALERRKLQDEYKETIALIKELEELLASPAKVLALIKQNLLDLKARYGDPRRTQIAERVQGTLTTHDLLPDEEVAIALTPDGMLKRYSAAGPSAYEVPAVRDEVPAVRGLLPSAAFLLHANTRNDLYLFSAKGQATRVPIHQIPESGSHYADLSGFGRRDRVVAMVALPKSSDQLPASSFLLLGTVQGKVKRVAVGDPSTSSGQALLDQAAANPPVIGLDEGDELLWADLSTGNGEFVLVTAQGQAIRFPEDEVRPMGLPAGGVGGIKLEAKDRVVAGMAIAHPPNRSTNLPSYLALATTACYAKRVSLAEFSAQGRNGQGVIALKVTPRSGEVAGAALCAPGDVLVFCMEGGKTRALPAADLPEQGRSTLGKFLPELAVGMPVEGVYAVTVEAEESAAEKFGGTRAKAEAQLAAPAAPTAEPSVKSARGKAKSEVQPAQAVVTPPEPAAKPARGKAKAEVQPAQAVATPAEAAVKTARGKMKAETQLTAPAAPTAEPSAKPARRKVKAETQPTAPAAPTTEPSTRPARGKPKAEMQPAPSVAAPPEPAAKPARGKVKVETQPAAPVTPIPEPSAKPARGKAKSEVHPAQAVAAPAEPVAKPVRGKTKAETQPATPVAASSEPATKPSARPARGKVKAQMQPAPEENR